MATEFEIVGPLVNYIHETNHIHQKQIISVLQLLKENCTIPFITRYRKEVTGGLDEVQIRNVQELAEEYTEREHRRHYILDNIKKMGLLTPELEVKINKASTLALLEDLYAPFKSKKKSKGAKAIEAGLMPLALLIQTTPLDYQNFKKEIGDKFNNPEHQIDSFDTAFEKAMDIIIEEMAHHIELKQDLRIDYWKEAQFVSQVKTEKEKASQSLDSENEYESGPIEKDDISKFKDYFDFSQKISELKSPKVAHRVLAIRRGMAFKFLKVEVQYPEDKALKTIAKYFFKKSPLGLIEYLEKAAKKSYVQYIHPSLDLEIKTELKQLADESCIQIFGQNLKNLLLLPYLGPKAVLGIDPGVRTGCKLAVVDETGKFIVDTVVYPHPPKRDIQKTKMVIEAILEKFKVFHIAIGNGTYGRETLELIENSISAVKENKVKATLVSEAGASVYSASDLAREEFPDKDPTVRGAISIARRFQDPLAELVKIDPKSIGVGQYQHDVNQSKLKKSLEAVVESCVNFVGVDINTASAPLLAHISGIGESLSQNVVKYREQKGIFKNRSEFLSIPRFSQKIFEQSAGFLRIYKGQNILDTTFIHPERYETLNKWSQKNKVTLEQLIADKNILEKLKNDQELKKEIGEFTLSDIVRALNSPSQDPRTEFKSTDFRKDMSSLSDLKVDEWYPGIITNITAFGAFVDIGLKENGLLHISEMADKFVEDALSVFKVGESIKVRVKEVDLSRKRISLSCKTQSSSRTTPISKDSNPNKNSFTSPAPELKNKAFSGLKNLKL